MIPLRHEDSQGFLASDLHEPASGSSPTTNRRRSERRPHRLSVKLLGTHGGDRISFLGLTENLSEGGAFVATRAPWEIGSTVDVIIGLSQQQFFHAKARVRWRREPWSESDRAPGIGIRFERLSAVDADRIREFASGTRGDAAARSSA